MYFTPILIRPIAHSLCFCRRPGKNIKQPLLAGLLVWLLVWLLTAGLSLFTAPLAAADTLSRIEAQQAIDVCIWPDYYGISYRNPKTRELSGIGIDLAQTLAQDLAVSLRFVDSSFPRLIDDLLSERCAVAIFAIAVTPERQRHLDFTQPHLSSGIYAVTTRSNRRIRSWQDIDRPGNVVAVARGTYHENIMRHTLRYARLLVTQRPNGREEEVQSGRADVFMTDYPYSRRTLETTPWARLIEPLPGTEKMPYAFALKPGDSAWLARLEEFVTHIKRDGRLADAARRHRLLPIVVSDTHAN
ncbi:substrate-binding periplasmic protein [Azonexus sp.]|uniref:substrate-binding periplasmic protein n=1 Tax=Azonexus sp. TaxID=1872668 RepID=UPI0039E68DC0